MPKTIALLTDFGLRDHYVAAMKGSILCVVPNAAIVDISHQVEPHNINEGAFTLWQASRWFPRGTIFVGVVDPGVGTGRKLIGLKTARSVFLAPDNGLLKFVMTFEKVQAIREISSEGLLERPISSTFHGRDILAPIAAKLSMKMPFSRIGPCYTPQETMQVQPAHVTKNQINADILYQDHFGNMITNVELDNLEQWRKKSCIKSRVKSKMITGLYENYQELPRGQAGFITGSAGLLEIACKESSAAKFLNISVGYEIIITQ
jgi:S-adenosyl-L-methionine hydrolase (adenosine-forming)